MKSPTRPSSSERSKRFASVRDLVKATASDDEQVREFEHRIKGATIVNALIQARSSAGMTQADVAEKMNCTQSAVSKLEHSTDAVLSLQDIASYLHATNSRLNFVIGTQPNRVERIKELAISFKAELEALADLSSKSDDRAIRQSINGFFGEAWFNLFSFLCDATSRLPQDPEDDSPLKLLAAESSRLPIGREKTSC